MNESISNNINKNYTITFDGGASVSKISGIKTDMNATVKQNTKHNAVVEEMELSAQNTSNNIADEFGNLIDNHLSATTNIIKEFTLELDTLKLKYEEFLKGCEEETNKVSFWFNFLSDPANSGIDEEMIKAGTREQYILNHLEEFEEFMGMTYDEYKQKVSELSNNIAIFQNYEYDLKQHEKQMPYYEIMTTEEYHKYLSSLDGKIQTPRTLENYFESNIKIVNGEPIYTQGKYDSVITNMQYLTQDQTNMYNYLVDTQGEIAALEYLLAIEDSLNKAKGQEEATKFLNSIINEDGSYDINAETFVKTTAKGIGDGIETFGEGLVHLFDFTGDGIKTDNQYAQMYILQALQETGQLDDKFLIGTYEISSSIGNMVPSIVLSTIAERIAPGSGEKVGNILMGMSAAGNAKNDALVSGANKLEAYGYGILSGASEAVIGMEIGNIPGLNANASFVLKNILSEGVEEFSQEWIDTFLRAEILGETIDLTEVVPASFKSFVYGMITSGIMTGSQKAINVTVNGVQHTINDVTELINLYNQKYNSEYRLSDRNWSHKVYKNLAKQYDTMSSVDQKTGESLEKIFFDEDNIIGIHRCGLMDGGTIIDDGLLLTGHITSGAKTVDVELEQNISFYDKTEMGYLNFIRDLKNSREYKTYGKGVGDVIIVSIPKNEINISKNGKISLKNSNSAINFSGVTAKLDSKYLLGYLKSSPESLGDIKVNLKYIEEKIEAKFSEYNYLIDIKKTNEYQIYVKNVSEGYAVIFNETYHNLEERLKKLETKINDLDSQYHDIVNDTLDSIIEQLGNAKGRRLLALYASTSNINHIPAEFQSQIANISLSDIKTYLNPEKTNIGTQFFGINIQNNKLNEFSKFYLDLKEKVKKHTGKTDEELKYLDDFNQKVLSYQTVENLIANLSSFNEWEMRQLLLQERTNPLIEELISTPFVINYLNERKSSTEIFHDFYYNYPNSTLVMDALNKMTSSELNNVFTYSVLKVLEQSPKEFQINFLKKHSEFLKENIFDFLKGKYSNELKIYIIDIYGNLELATNWNFEYISIETQKILIEKIKETLYNGNFNNFLTVVSKINDPNYQTEVIKNSPFYSELINSSNFTKLFVNIKDSTFAFELFKNKNAREKIISDSSAFSKILSFLTIEQQQEYLNIAKEKILELKSSNDIFKNDKIVIYIKSFAKELQFQILTDENFIASLDKKNIIELNDNFDNVYIEILKSWVNEPFDSISAKIIFIPEIYETLDQEIINKAVISLDKYDYDELIELNNQEALDTLINIIISNNYNNFKDSLFMVSSLVKIYNAANDEGKIKIQNSITPSILIECLTRINSEYMIDILLHNLEVNPNYFDNLTISSIKKISEYDYETYKKIFPYLKDEYKMVTFNLKNINKLGLENEIIEIFRKDSNLINYMNNDGALIDFLSILTDENDINLFYENLKIDTLFKNSLNKTFSNLDLNKVKDILKNNLPLCSLSLRGGSGFVDVSDYGKIERVLKYYLPTEQIELLNTLKTEDKYLMLLLNITQNQNIKIQILKDMMNDSNLRSTISDSNMQYFNDFFDSLNIETIEYIMENSNNSFLAFLMSITKRNDLNLKFSKMIKENPLILSQFNSTDAETVYCNLTDENITIIDNYVNSTINSINNQKINTLLNDATIAQKSTFINAYNQGLINDAKLDLLIKIKEKNKFVLSTFNYQLFDDTIYQFGPELLTKLSKYYDIVDQIVALKQYPQKFNLFANMIINDKTSSMLVADQKMAIVLDYLLNNEIDSILTTATNLTELETSVNIILKEIDQFSILGANMKDVVRVRSIIKPDEYSLFNYQDKLAEKCDALLQEVTTPEEVQNLIFNKYFSMSIEDATELFRMYGSKFSNIKDLDTMGIATIYLENIYNILSLSTLEESIEFYNSFENNNRYTASEMLNIINEIKQIYTKSLKDTLFIPSNVTVYVEYNSQMIPIYEPQGDFQMLVQSTYTDYGGMPMINNNYFDSWNLSSRTSNHGICCSLISNNNMGMAKVKGSGIVIGFNSFTNEQMNMMAPYDIYTRNDGYLIKCQRPLLYLPGQEVMNETRHTHNEFNLERTNLTGEGQLANIQPDYVVVFEEMTNEQKQNAYKASLEFNVPLVYLNKTTLAMQESTKIDNLIVEYNNTGNIELLEQILVLHENNRSGYRVSNPELVTQYFPTDKITFTLENAIEKCESKEELEFIREFLIVELLKFDITHEATHRINEVDVPIKKLIEKIEQKLNISN